MKGFAGVGKGWAYPHLESFRLGVRKGRRDMAKYVCSDSGVTLESGLARRNLLNPERESALLRKRLANLAIGFAR